MYEVHVFEAIGTASADSEGAYRPGDRHAMMVFIRQAAETDHDWESAQAGVNDAGWSQVNFQRAGTLIPENLNGKDSDFVGAFEHAMHGGCGLVVYAAPLHPEHDE
jgi:hypothetical protein